MLLDMGVGSTGENITKSYVGFGEWKSASQIPKETQRMLRTSKYSPAHHVPWPHKRDKRASLNGQPFNRKLGTKVVTRTENLPNSDGMQISGVAQPNGLGGGVITLGRRSGATTERHEMAHLQPKRNPHTFQERRRDPAVRGREEGRADFIASGKATPNRYPGKGRGFGQGYREVQGKMTAAKRRQVSKSVYTLDMGGAMVSETPKKDLPVRDLQTGRFVATPHLQRMSRAHDSLVWEKENDG